MASFKGLLFKQRDKEATASDAGGLRGSIYLQQSEWHHDVRACA
jgi:hypothetical protein